MATYSYDPADLGTDAVTRVRFLLGDVGPADWLLANEEIQYLLTSLASEIEAAIQAALNIAARYSRLADQTTGRISIRYSQLTKQYQEVAERLRKHGDGTGGGASGLFVGGITFTQQQANDSNSDLRQGQFGVGQFDDPSALLGEIGNDTEDERYG